MTCHNVAKDYRVYFMDITNFFGRWRALMNFKFLKKISYLTLMQKKLIINVELCLLSSTLFPNLLLQRNIEIRNYIHTFLCLVCCRNIPWCDSVFPKPLTLLFSLTEKVGTFTFLIMKENLSRLLLMVNALQLSFKHYSTLETLALWGFVGERERDRKNVTFLWWDSGNAPLAWVLQHDSTPPCRLTALKRQKHRQSAASLSWLGGRKFISRRRRCWE